MLTERSADSAKIATSAAIEIQTIRAPPLAPHLRRSSGIA
jgi:hypothetical protein